MSPLPQRPAATGAFALPQYDGVSVRLLLAMDETAVQLALARSPPEAVPTATNGLGRRAWQRSVRLEAFLGAAAGSPPSQQWSSTVDGRSAEELAAEAAEAAAAAAASVPPPTPAPTPAPTPTPAQHTEC